MSQEFTTRSKKAISLFREADNYRVRGQYRQAADLLQQALNKDDEFSEAWFLLGLTYKMAYKLEPSVESFEKAKMLFPSGKIPMELFFELGQVYMYEGKYEKARDNLSTFLDLGGVNTRNANYAKKGVIDADYALEHIGDASKFEPR